MAAYHRVYDSRHLQADYQEPGSAPEPYAQQSIMGYLTLVCGARSMQLSGVRPSVRLSVCLSHSLAALAVARRAVARLLLSVDHNYANNLHLARDR